MATYVLVHGGGHGGWCYQRVARLLRANGHEVYTPSLSGLGERAHLLDARIDLSCHIDDVVALLRFEDLRDVILVGHSYGGMVITGVGDRAADRVGRLVFLDAATPRNGESLVDVAGPVINAVRSYGEVVDGIELVLLPGPDAGLLYGVTDPADLAWMAERLTPHPWACFEQPLELTNEDCAVGHPAVPHRVHLHPGDPRPRGHGPRPVRGPTVGHRHGPRPDDHRAREDGRRIAPGRRQAEPRRSLRPCMCMGP